MTIKSFNARHGITVGANTIAIVDANGNITANTILVGGSALNSTAFAGTANNASFLNGQPAAYYTNASNLSTGTINVLRLPTSGVTANVYGNSSSIPVVTVDTYGRVTSVTTSAVAGVTSFDYTAANSTFSIGTGAGSTYTATITAANSTVAGIVTVLDSTTNTSITIAASANTVKNAFDRAIDANTRAASAQTAAISAYSNAVSYTDSAIAAANVSGAAAIAYTNATSFASNVAATAYSNAVSTAASDATSKAATAYSNAVSTAAADATSKANNAYTTAVSAASTDATNKAANAYSNAVSYAATIAGTAYSNAVSTAAADATSKANNAYTTAVSAAASDATSKANNAYTTAVAAAASDATSKANNAYITAVSAAASDATSKANNAYTTAVAAAASDASSKASTAYTNATGFAANASNISSGTLAEARLPYRMNQNVRTTDTVEFGNMTVTGNLTVTGTTVTVNANNLVVQDNMIYLNDGNVVTNPDLGIAGNYNDGTYRHAGFFRDASDGVWKVYDQYLPEPDATPYIDTSNASFRVADFQANVVTMASANVGGAIINSTSYSGAANNASYLGTYAASAYPRKSEAAAIDGAWNFSSHSAVWSGHSYTNTYDGNNVYLHIGTASSTDKIWNVRVYRADNSVALFAFNGNGRYATAEGSWRAPLFYDTDNTSYYVDPASTSYLNNSTFVGTVGIGTSSPGAKLETYQNIGGTNAIRMNTNFAGGNYVDLNPSITGVSNGGYSISLNGNIYQVISVDGNTGVGTTSPATKLHVGGGSLRIEHPGDRALDFIRSGASTFTIEHDTSRMYFYNASTANNIMSFSNASNVGIGVADADYKLDVRGIISSTVDVRAPIFYDSNNTGFYVDPATGSNLTGQVQITGGTAMTGGWNRTLYLAASFPSIVFNSGNSKYSGIAVDYTDANDGMRFWVNGSSADISGTGTIALRINTGNYIIANDVRAAIFYDTNNTGYFLDGSATSNIVNLTINGVLDVGASNPQYWRSPNLAYQRVDGRDDNTLYSRMHWYGVRSDGATSNFRHAWFDGSAYFGVDADTGFINFTRSGGGAVTSDGSFRAPIFYDSGDTNYYTDANSTSRFKRLILDNGDNLSWGAGYGAGVPTIAGSTNTALYFYPTGSTAGAAFTMYGSYAVVTGSMRAPMFYDSDNTAYYADPASFSNLSSILIGDSGNGYAYGAAATGKLYFGSIGADAGTHYHITTNMENVGGNYSKLDLRWYTGVRFYAHYAYGGVRFKEITTGNTIFSVGEGDLRVRAYDSMAAPVYYDYDNTAYYLDPASTTYINQLQILGGNPVYPAQWTTGYQSSSDFTDGTLVTTDIPATASAGDSFIIEITGKSYSATNLPFKVIAQGYLYNDTIINYTGASYAGTFSSYIKAFQDGGVLKFWWPRISYWNSFEVRVISMDGPTNNTITRNRVTSITNATEPTGTKKVQINLGTFMRADVTATNAEDLRAPIFYDSNNTGYYINPNGTSNIYQLTGAITYGSYGSFSASGTYGGYAGISFPDKSAALMIGDGVGTPSGFYFTNNTWGMYSYKNSVYTAVMYDIDDSSYRVDPTSTSVFNALTVGGVSVALGSYRNYGEQSFAPVGGSMTTAQFINDLNNKGLFNYRHAVAKASWSYAGNDDISDIGFNGCDLAGTVVETFVNADGTKTVWLTRPTTGAGNGSIYVWNDQGSGYSPGWRQVWTSGVSCYNGVDIRAPIFYDIDNTASYIDPAGTSRIGGEVRFGGGGNSSVITTDGDFYSRRASATNTGVYYFADGGNKYLYWDASRYYFGSQGPVDTDVSFRAPVFYDLNNTGYYLDPASTSSGNLAGYLYFANHGGGIVGNYSSYRYQLVYGMGDSYKGSLDGTSVAGGYGLWWSHPNAGGVASNLSNHGLMCIVNGQFFASLDASTRAITDMRSPIFYDLNNTGFYCDPNSYSSFYGVAIRGDQNATAAGNQLFLWDAGGTTTSAIGFKQVGGAWAEYGSTTGGYNTYFTMDTAGRGWVFRRSTNPGGDFSGTNVASITNTGIATFSDSVRTPIFYDSNDTGYYVNPNGASQMSSVYANDWFRPQGQSGLYFQDYGGGWHMTDTTWIRAYNGKAVYVSNEIAATGNITAYYSDERLKTRVGNINDALDRVLRLDGFYYTENETARELGYNSDRQQVGVSAQQIQEVLPEAVYMAPVDIAVDEDGNKYSKTGENYLTVDYSRLVPLLIEAIKEQQLTITEQSAKINTLEAKLDLIIQKLEG